MRSVEEHQRVIARLISPRQAGGAPLADALGLVLADDVIAGLSLPVFDNSAMDGYAVRVEDVAWASASEPVKLVVAEDIPAGRIDSPILVPGTAHRIMTGTPMPPGATAVVPVERTDGRVDTVTISASATPGQHIRRAGEDVAVGTRVLDAGRVVTPAVLGLVAALGLGELPVIGRQLVLVISTGSELVAPGAALLPGQIYESNAIMLAAAAQEAGAEVVAVLTCDDDIERFTAMLDSYADRADLIITSGGISAGAYEVVKDALEGDDGRVEFIKVAMQPGMPQGAGTVHDTAIVTLPGNPVSALVSFEVLIRPALRAAMGFPQPNRPLRFGVLAEPITSPAGKRQFRRGVYDPDTGIVLSYGPPASHHLRWLASANCLLDIAAEVTALDAGERVQLWDLSSDSTADVRQ